jgi:hypothetical protein
MTAPLALVAAQATVLRARNKRARRTEPQKRWPALGALGLCASEIAARRDAIGGSDANIILSGDPDRIVQLWREKRGEAARVDLSGVLQVMLGSWTEAFNRQWYERETGELVSEVGSVAQCQDYGWRRCTLDGMVKARGAVWEAKHVSGLSKPEEVLARYMPQLQHNMAVKGCDLALMSVIYGNHKWEVYEIAADWLYQDDLLAAEQGFWDCVTTGAVSVAVLPPPPPRPNATRELCFEGHNLWATFAGEWLETREPARRQASAVSALKDLVEADVARAFGHGIEAKRSKSGALTIKELAQ